MKNIHSYTLTLILTISAAIFASAQVAEDALLISRSMPTGSARFLGFGGAGVALGGDVTSAYLNPAGLGFYNRSQAVLTPSFQNVNTNTSFLGVNSETYNTNFNISNFGVVINNSKDDIIPPDYRGGSFAITYHQTNSYNFDHNFGPGVNQFSILDEFALRANGVDVGIFETSVAESDFPFYEDAAYANRLIINVPDDNEAYFAAIPQGTTAEQQGSIEEEGRQSQWNFAYGGNFKDKLYFGASIGFKNFTYERNNRFTEVPLYTEEYLDNLQNDDFTDGAPFFPVDDQLSIDRVDNVSLNETLRIDGSGINATLGLIYRPVDELSLGFSYRTPTFYSLTEEYFFSLSSLVIGIQETDNSPVNDLNQTVQSPINVSEYTLSTPSRISGGFAYFFEKYGFLTADVEYVNYASNTFGSNDFNTGEINDQVDMILESVINYRFGGEFRYNIFRLRAGYAMYADPTQYVDDPIDRDRQMLTGGIGIKTSKFFADLAVTNTQYGTDTFPYLDAQFFEGGLVELDHSVTNVILSVGFNF